jgi:hypothetical protein
MGHHLGSVQATLGYGTTLEVKWIVFHNWPATAAWHLKVADKPLVNPNLTDHSPLLIRLFSRLQHR